MTGAFFIPFQKAHHLPNGHTLGKKERLKSRKQLDRLFKEGRALTVPPFRVLFILEPQSAEAPVPALQFSVGASIRNFKKAVDRNLIKRRVREAYRQQKIGLENALNAQGGTLRIFFIYTARELPEWDLVNAKMQLALQELEKEIARSPRP